MHLSKNFNSLHNHYLSEILSRIHYVFSKGFYLFIYFELLNFILFIFLCSRFLLVIHFIHISVYMSIPISQFIPPPPHPPAAFPAWCPYVCSLHLCLNFCPAHRFICTISLGTHYRISTY